MNERTKKLTTQAMLCAIAFLMMLIVHIKVFDFLTYDPKDVAIVIGGFLFGPLTAFTISLVVSLVEMVTVSSTGPIGLIMNLLSSAAFACPAAFLYKKNKTISGAVWGLILGVLIATATMLLWNFLITPLYMNAPRAEVVGILLPVILPFNLLKGIINAAFALILYKPAANALRRSHLIPQSEENGDGRFRLGLILVAGILMITCFLILMVVGGIL